MVHPLPCLRPGSLPTRWITGSAHEANDFFSTSHRNKCSKQSLGTFDANEFRRRSCASRYHYCQFSSPPCPTKRDFTIRLFSNPASLGSVSVLVPVCLRHRTFRPCGKMFENILISPTWRRTEIGAYGGVDAAAGRLEHDAFFMQMMKRTYAECHDLRDRISVPSWDVNIRDWVFVLDSSPPMSGHAYLFRKTVPDNLIASYVASVQSLSGTLRGASAILRGFRDTFSSIC